MLLTEQQTEEYLDEMIQHYTKKENDSKQLSWDRSEAEYRKKSFQDMRMILFGDVSYGSQREKIT
tara:strand:- start:176 stop:370 length:195 start_codon:yes stop_codon:yes gene_type:complete